MTRKDLGGAKPKLQRRRVIGCTQEHGRAIPVLVPEGDGKPWPIVRLSDNWAEGRRGTTDEDWRGPRHLLCPGLPQHKVALVMLSHIPVSHCDDVVAKHAHVDVCNLRRPLIRRGREEEVRGEVRRRVADEAVPFVAFMALAHSTVLDRGGAVRARPAGQVVAAQSTATGAHGLLHRRCEVHHLVEGILRLNPRLLIADGSLLQTGFVHKARSLADSSLEALHLG
mmetsp:Transcript_44424/g.96573  ORF Transcript_44424/g.96573 Transcript_44424/m.96573 type:complete len:225 (+) Transcript_44424:969-1643(+)